MRHAVFPLTNVIIIMIIFDRIDSRDGCSDQEHSPLCFCRSFQRHPLLIDLFLAKISLSQCDHFHHCRQSRFHPPSFNLTQLTNLSHCLDDIHCLHPLHSIQHCRRCQLIYNDSYRTDTCWNLCEKNPSCGVICLNQPAIVSINCEICQGQMENISCRCIKPSSSSSCLRSFYDTTTPRWMQKRGFPAAGILALVILAVALVVIAIKLIYRQLDIIDRRHSLAAHQSILSCQPSPNYLTKPRMFHAQSQDLVVEIHRCGKENELSILLLEKTPKKD